MTDSSFKTFASVLFLPIFGVAVLLPLQNAQARTIITPTVKVPPVHAIHTGAPVSSIPANQLHGSHYINNGALYKPKQISAKGNFGGPQIRQATRSFLVLQQNRSFCFSGWLNARVVSSP